MFDKITYYLALPLMILAFLVFIIFVLISLPAVLIGGDRTFKFLKGLMETQK